MQWSYTRLTTQQWGIIEKILPVKQKSKYKLRDIVDAIFNPKNVVNFHNHIINSMLQCF